MSDPGPQPDPVIEPAEPNPGGPDALEDGERYSDHAQTPDLNPEKNPSVDDVVPDEIAEPDDKQQEPEEGRDERQRAEDAEEAPEPPA